MVAVGNMSTAVAVFTCLKRRESDTPSDGRLQSASDQPGHNVEHAARRVLCGMVLRKRPEMVKFKPKSRTPPVEEPGVVHRSPQPGRQDDACSPEFGHTVTSDCKRHSASDAHGHEVDHVTRHVVGAHLGRQFTVKLSTESFDWLIVCCNCGAITRTRSKHDVEVAVPRQAGTSVWTGRSCPGSSMLP